MSPAIHVHKKRGALSSCRSFLGSLALGTSGVWTAMVRNSAYSDGIPRSPEPLVQALERELGANPYPIPGAVVMVGAPDEILFHEAVGFAQLEPEKTPMQRDSIFDVASVTKVVATATACALCVDRGLLDPNAPLTKYLPDHRGKGVEKISLRRLAVHTSGFAENPRLGAAGTGEAMFQAMLAESPTWEVNARYEYACRNTILLSTIVERVTGQSFGAFCTKEIFAPLGMNESAFNRVAPSSRVAGTDVELGVSHNSDTIAAGRPIGNAGLFTTAPDLARFCQMMLNGGMHDGKRILSEKVIADFTTTDQLPQFVAKGFIWSTGTGDGHRPARLSERAFGHGGWTGIGLWIDPGKRVFTLVLSNRIHPRRADRRSRDVQYAKLGRCADLALKQLAI